MVKQSMITSLGGMIWAGVAACSSESGNGGRDDGGIAGDSGVTNNSCSAEVCSTALGVPAVCGRRIEPQCFPIEMPGVTISKETPYDASKNPVLFAYVASPSLSKSDQERVRAAELAFAEINEVEGLPTVDVEGGRRPIVLLIVDVTKIAEDLITSHLVAVSDHLASIGVQGIIGPVSILDSPIMASQAAQRELFLIEPTAPPPEFPPNDLVWWSASSLTNEATAMAALVPYLEQDARALYAIPSENKVKVASVGGLGKLELPPLLELSNAVHFNGGASTSSSPEYLSLAMKLVPPDELSATSALLAFEPHVITSQISPSDMFSTVTQKTEQLWSAAVRPFWLFSRVYAAESGFVTFAANAYPAMRTRMRGVDLEDGLSPAAAEFLQRYNARFSTTLEATSLTRHTAYAYDAAYLLAYANYAGRALTHRENITGRETRLGALRLLGGAGSRPFGVGPGTAIAEAFERLRAGGTIDLGGVGNNLNFDGKQGVIPLSETALREVCVSSAQRMIATGRRYISATHAWSGDYSCP